MLPAVISRASDKKHPSEGNPSVLKKIIFSLVALFLITACLEGLLRLLPLAGGGPETNRSDALPLWVISNMKESNFIPDRLLFWRVPPSTPRLHTNAHGLRGPEFSAVKEKGVYRIITLGDSCTWGFGVRPGEEYPHQLRQCLNQSTIPLIFEVQNAGVPGYSSLQGLRYLQSELLRYHPDLITLYFGRNDHRSLHEEGGYAPDAEVPVPSPLAYKTKNALNHLRLYRLFRAALLRIKSKIAKNDPSLRGRSTRSGRRYRVEPDEFENNFRAMIRTAQDHNILVITITAPVFPPSVGQYNEIVRRISREADVWCLDAAVEFAKHDGNGWLVDDCHPNPEGHRWIARELCRKIISIVSDQPPSPPVR